MSRQIDESVFGVVELMESLTIEAQHGPMVLERRGKATAGAPQAVWSGDGLFIAIRRDAAVKAGIYPLRIELQGRLCSTDTNGLSVAEEMRAAVIALLYPGLADEEIDDEIYPGRFDLCVDCALDGDPTRASDWIEHVLFGSGSVDRAVERWSTRAAPASRKSVATYAETPDDDDEAPVTSARMLGLHATGRTQYLGRNPQLRVYEKDREMSKGFDGPIVRARWLEAKWNETDRVIRVEWEVTREWITAQTLWLAKPKPVDETALPPTRPRRGRPRKHHPEPDVEKVPIAASTLTWQDWWPLLGMIATRLTKRFRHVVLDDPRRSRCTTSGWWATVTSAVRDLDATLGPWNGVAELKTTQRDLAYKRARRRIVLGLTDLQLWHPKQTLAEIGATIGTEEDAKGPQAPDGTAPRESLVAGEHPDFVKRRERQQRMAHKLGLAMPPKVLERR